MKSLQSQIDEFVKPNLQGEYAKEVDRYSHQVLDDLAHLLVNGVPEIQIIEIMSGDGSFDTSKFIRPQLVYQYVNSVKMLINFCKTIHNSK